MYNFCKHYGTFKAFGSNTTGGYKFYKNVVAHKLFKIHNILFKNEAYHENTVTLKYFVAQVLGKVTHQHGHLDHHQEGYRHAYHNHHHSHLNHHSQDYGHHGYHNDGHEHHAHVHGGHGHGHAHGYSAVLAAEPVITKAVSAGPVVFSKGLAHAPAAVSVHSHTPAYTVAAAPLAAVGHVPAYSVAPALSHEHVALLATAGKPKVYQKSVPAAAIRNIETVMVTKTITPVVTKTTTYLTKAEPALSLGHVQGTE